MADCPTFSCQAERHNDKEGEAEIIKCNCEVFLMGMIFKRVSRLLTGGAKDQIAPTPVEICAVCGAINSKGFSMGEDIVKGMKEEKCSGDCGPDCDGKGGCDKCIAEKEAKK